MKAFRRAVVSSTFLLAAVVLPASPASAESCGAGAITPRFEHVISTPDGGVWGFVIGEGAVFCSTTMQAIHIEVAVVPGDDTGWTEPNVASWVWQTQIGCIAGSHNYQTLTTGFGASAGVYPATPGISGTASFTCADPGGIVAWLVR